MRIISLIDRITPKTIEFLTEEIREFDSNTSFVFFIDLDNRAELDYIKTCRNLISGIKNAYGIIIGDTSINSYIVLGAFAKDKRFVINKTQCIELKSLAIHLDSESKWRLKDLNKFHLNNEKRLNEMGSIFQNDFNVTDDVIHNFKEVILGNCPNLQNNYIPIDFLLESKNIKTLSSYHELSKILKDSNLWDYISYSTSAKTILINTEINYQTEEQIINFFYRFKKPEKALFIIDSHGGCLKNYKKISNLINFFSNPYTNIYVCIIGACDSAASSLFFSFDKEKRFVLKDVKGLYVHASLRTNMSIITYGTLKKIIDCDIQDNTQYRDWLFEHVDLDEEVQKEINTAFLDLEKQKDYLLRADYLASRGNLSIVSSLKDLQAWIESDRVSRKKKRYKICIPVEKGVKNTQPDEKKDSD